MSFYPSQEDRDAIALAIFLVLALALALILAGCGTEVRPPAQAPSPVAVLGSIGSTLAWVGGISAAAGLAFSVISLIYPPLQPFSIVFRLIGAGGAGVTGVGVTYLWFAQNFWVAVVFVVAACLGVLWWFWPRLHRVVDRRLQASRK